MMETIFPLRRRKVVDFNNNQFNLVVHSKYPVGYDMIPAGYAISYNLNRAGNGAF